MRFHTKNTVTLCYSIFCVLIAGLLPCFHINLLIISATAASLLVLSEM